MRIATLRSALAAPVRSPSNAKVQRWQSRPSQNRRLTIKGRNNRVEAVFAFAFLSGLISIVAYFAAADPSWWTIIGIGTAVNALCLVHTLRASGFEWQSGPVAYLLVLWLFHFPLTLFISLRVNLDSSLPSNVLSWAHYGSWYGAAAYANACAAGFVLGCLFARRRWGVACEVAPRPNTAFYHTGLITSALAACGLAVVFMRGGGSQVFSMSYGSLYRSGTLFGAEFTLACFLVAVGVTMAVPNAVVGKRWRPIALQCAVTVVVLLTGARSYALMGALVLVVIAAKASLRIRPMVLVSGFLLVLLVISAVGVARSRGVVVSRLDSSSVGPTAALAEMGGSLKTVTLAIDWIEGGDQPQWGGGYWLPVERALGLILPGSRKDLSTDPRAMSEVMLSRVSGLGGSVVAESFYNFKLAGIGVFVLLGYLLGYLHLKAHSPAAVAFESIVLYALILEVRNWFISVPAMIALGAVPILIGLCFQGQEPRRRRAPLSQQ